SCSAERKHARPRQKMVQRLFLNRIDTEPAASAIGSQRDPIAHALPDKTKSALALVQFATPRAQAALNAPIGQHHPPARWIISLTQLRDYFATISQLFHE